MAEKLEDKLKVVTFITNERLDPILDQIFENSDKEKVESVQVQIVTKGYENRKDPKKTSEIPFPNEMRRDANLCVIGDSKVKEKLKDTETPFALISEYEGKQKEKDRLLKKYNTFICCPGYAKAFPLKEIILKRRIHFICNNIDQLNAQIEKCRYTYKLRVKDWSTFSFPAGHTGLTKEQVRDNLKAGIQFVADTLKKGPLSMKNVFVKRTTGQSFKLH